MSGGEPVQRCKRLPGRQNGLVTKGYFFDFFEAFLAPFFFVDFLAVFLAAM